MGLPVGPPGGTHFGFCPVEMGHPPPPTHPIWGRASSTLSTSTCTTLTQRAAHARIAPPLMSEGGAGSPRELRWATGGKAVRSPEAAVA